MKQKIKQLMKKIVVGIMVLSIATSLVTMPQKKDVQAAVKKVYITKGKTTKITVKKAAKTTKWISSKKGIVKIITSKNSIKIKGLKKGNTTVKATIAGKKVQYRIMVETPKISKKTATIKEGESIRLSMKNTQRKVVWSSDDKNIATVNKSTGEVVAKVEGTVAIYAFVGGLYYACEVTVIENDTTKKEEIRMEEIYIKNGDREVYGKMYRPDRDGTFPAVILSHGYNGIADDFINECTYYAERGYIALAIDFCGGSVRTRSKGLASTEMTIFTEKADLLAVFDYIYEMQGVDKEHVYLFGGSQGGLVTTLAAEERADKVKAVALYYPALCIADNWRDTYPTVDMIPQTNDFWGLKLGKEFFTSIHDFYVFDNIGKYDKNVFILHGDNDAIVPLSYSERAIKLYPHATLQVMDGEGHGFSQTGAKTAMKAVFNFMEENK